MKGVSIWGLIGWIWRGGKCLHDSTMANWTIHVAFAAIEPAFLRPMAMLYEAAV
jgi:hypothetical protein